MTPRRRTDAVLLALPALTLLALAVPVLARVPLWRDESATWAFSTLGFRDLATATGHVDRVFAPYYSLVHTLRLMGLDELACRGLSVLAAVGTVTMVQLLGRTLWSTTAGFAAALTLVTNPMFIVSSTSLRPYALATCATTVATWIIVRRPQHLSLRARWWLYLAAILAAVQLHLFSAVLAVPHLLWLWLRVRGRVAAVATAWGITGLLSAPLLLLSARQSGQVAWISSPTWESTARQAAIATGSDLHSLGALTNVVVAGCALLGLVSWARQGRVDPRWLLAVLLWLWPVIALTAVSLLASPVAVWRYFMSTAVGAALLVGYGVTAVRRALLPRSRAVLGNRGLVIALLGATVACLLPALVIGRPAATTLEGHPDIDRALVSSVRRGDRVVIRQGMSETGYAYGFARGTGDTAFADDAVRSLVDGQPPFFVREVVRADGRTMTTRAPSPGTHGRVWLVQLYGDTDLRPAGIAGCTTTGTVRTVRQTRLVPLTCS